MSGQRLGGGEEHQPMRMEVQTPKPYGTLIKLQQLHFVLHSLLLLPRALAHIFTHPPLPTILAQILREIL